jgi:acetaldehyde dehydrogenase
LVDREMHKKTKVVIIGSGNIGIDLLFKIERSANLSVGLLIGIDPKSEGLALAKGKGVPVTHRGIQELVDNPECGEIVFDATSAKAHMMHAPILKELGKIAIDLTPAGLGQRVVPVVNLHDHLEKDNICLITCGGQAVIPIVSAISSAAEVKYAEIVSTIASKSAGPGTRQNIDEFTQTTRLGIEEVGKVERGKAIMILNPAEPPIVMHNTIYCLVNGEVDKEKVMVAVENMAKNVKSYVPGYTLKAAPLFDGNKITVMLQVTGAGDYLPTYAGNLDIMTCAAVAAAEVFAAKRLGKHGGLTNE